MEAQKLARYLSKGWRKKGAGFCKGDELESFAPPPGKRPRYFFSSAVEQLLPAPGTDRAAGEENRQKRSGRK